MAATPDRSAGSTRPATARGPSRCAAPSSPPTAAAHDWSPVAASSPTANRWPSWPRRRPSSRRCCRRSSGRDDHARRSVERGDDSGVEGGVHVDVAGAIRRDAHHARVGLVERRAAGRRRSRRCTRRSPRARATATMSVPCGVPNSCSNRSTGSAVACGRNEKIAPPSLSVTTIVRSRPRARNAVSDDMSWQKATSPSSTAVGAPLPIATPIAVAITPSIPLAPRLACTATSLRGAPNHSTSRTGIDEATTRWPPAGTRAVTARAVPGSDSRSDAASAASSATQAARSASRHSSNHGGRRTARGLGRQRRAQLADRCVHLSGTDEVWIRDQPGG